MKKTMMWAILALVAIVIVSSFGLQIAPITPKPLPAGVNPGDVLYVCPVSDSFWDGIKNAIAPFEKYIFIGLFACALILMFTWGWALYQNLLKDKFKKDAYKKSWDFTKLLFWAVVIALMLTFTPNYFRTVHLTGNSADWVLCDNNSPNARAVKETHVRP